MMNIAAIVSMTNNITAQSKGQLQASVEGNQVFGNVFGQVLSNSQVQQPMPSSENSVEADLMNELLAILGMDSIKELESLLGKDELTVNPKELEQLMNTLLGKDPALDLEETNVWDLLAGINEQASQLKDAIVASLNGQGPATQAEAKQVVELLKIAQLIGLKSDLTLKQESTVFDLKQLLENVAEAASTIKTTETKTVLPMQGMKPVVQQVIIKQVTQNTEVVVEKKEVTVVQQVPTPQIPQAKVETVTVTLPAQKPAQSEELMKQLEKAMNRIQFGQAGGANRLVVKLYPEQLGTIRIELIQKDGQLTARMLASTALGKDLLDSNSNQLRQGLVNQNIQIEKIEISQALQDAARQDRNQTFNQSFKQQQQEQQESSNDEPEEQSSFRDFLMEMEA
ncbi:flagellar hook-length control protein FliK [Psychrobacillus sp.]|uniref:flagellar hook-length control protein FliK n=1 Tax=Psychrobacillus sp. TaxID=1871623 RepID=UPI0028BEBA94|nr:flagellar hook-length control protein FliK [Psychrobacillus sp.]